MVSSDPINRPSFIRRIIDRPITILMIFLSLVGMGVIAYVKIPVNLLPDGFSNSHLTLWVPYRDASPKEVEDKITQPVEEILRTIPGIKNINSRSSPSGSRVRIEFLASVDLDLAYCEVKDRMERIKPDFPEEVDDYFCFRFNMDTDLPIIWMAVLYEDWVPNPYTKAEEVIKNQLEGVDGVANINMMGFLEDAVRIFLDPQKVRGYRINLYDLITRMGQDNFAQPAGDIKDENRRYLLRVDAKYRSIEEIENYPVTDSLKIKDIGEVVLGRAYRDYVARVNSKEAVIFAISKESQQNTVEVCKAVEAKLDSLKKDNRLDGFSFLTFFNQRELIESSLGTLKTSLAWGGLFAVLVLYFFLRNLKATFMVALAIPTSIIIALVVIYFSGRTFNLLSLAGFTLAVGMLVDNAIVVIENINRYRAQDLPVKESAALGATKVGTAILMGTLTTIVVFLPLIFFQEDNNIRLMLSEVGLPISFSLLASLLTALVFIPLSMTYLIRMKTSQSGQAAAALKAYHEPGRVTRLYEKGLGWVLNHRFGTFFLAILLFMSMQVAIEFVEPGMGGEGGEQQVRVEVDLPRHFTLNEANEVFSQLESFTEENKQRYAVDAYSIFFDRRGGTVQYFLEDSVTLAFEKDLREKIRKELPRLAGVEYDLGSDSAGEAQKDFRIEVSGPDSGILANIIFDLKDRLRLVPEVTNIRTDIEEGLDEVRVEINRELAQKFDVSPEVLRGTVAWGLGGQRLPDYEDAGREIRMQIEYDEVTVESLDVLKNLSISTNTGAVIPLGTVARMKVTQGVGSIGRRNGRTMMGLTATPVADNVYTVSRKVTDLMENYPFPQGYTWMEEGGRTEYDDQMMDIQGAFILSVALVFILMGTLFESTILPLSALLSIPFAIAGSIWLMVFTGTAMDPNAMVGFILLAGIVVNNAIVLIDHINRLRQTGLDRKRAILQGGRERLRPIIMTAMTTIFGLLPMAMPSVFSSGTQSAVFSYQSLAIVVLGGLALSTVTTLFVVPLFYTFFDDLRVKSIHLLFRGLRLKKKSGEPVERIA